MKIITPLICIFCLFISIEVMSQEIKNKVDKPSVHTKNRIDGNKQSFRQTNLVLQVRPFNSTIEVKKKNQLVKKIDSIREPKRLRRRSIQLSACPAKNPVFTFRKQESVNVAKAELRNRKEIMFKAKSAATDK